MEKLETLIFELNKKEEELDNIRTDTFVFNPKIKKLVIEIEKLKNEIEQIKSEGNNG